MYAVLGNYPDCLEILLRNGSDATLGKDITRNRHSLLRDKLVY
jgi:hypothetical protein